MCITQRDLKKDLKTRKKTRMCITQSTLTLWRITICDGSVGNQGHCQTTFITNRVLSAVAHRCRAPHLGCQSGREAAGDGSKAECDGSVLSTLSTCCEGVAATCRAASGSSKASAAHRACADMSYSKFTVRVWATQKETRKKPKCNGTKSLLLPARAGDVIMKCEHGIVVPVLRGETRFSRIHPI